MARIRKIYRNPAQGKNYFVIDANFLANKYIPSNRAPNPREETRIQKCLEWWTEIDSQLDINKARVYIPDLCIAETFKVLAQKYYDRWFHNYSEYSKARRCLIGDITVSDKILRAHIRQIKYHDISTSRDIIISVDRFYEVFHREGLTVQLPDLVIQLCVNFIPPFKTLLNACFFFRL
ncbi:hypothetical protein ES703_109673 [subsurface metagenome]